MDLSTLIERFTFYATNHKDIGHIEADKKHHAFFHIDTQEFQQKIVSGLKLPCLLLQTPEVEKSGAYDNMSEHWDFTYMVLVKKANKSKAQMSAEAKAISDDIMNMVMADVEAGLLPSLVPGSNEGLVGPLIDQLFGWGASIGIEDGYDGSVNPNKWLHLTPGQP